MMKAIILSGKEINEKFFKKNFLLNFSIFVSNEFYCNAITNFDLNNEEFYLEYLKKKPSKKEKKDFNYEFFFDERMNAFYFKNQDFFKINKEKIIEPKNYSKFLKLSKFFDLNKKYLIFRFLGGLKKKENSIYLPENVLLKILNFLF